MTEVLAVAFSESSGAEFVVCSATFTVYEDFLVVDTGAVCFSVCVEGVVSVFVFDKGVASGFAF